jgi:hypothetical protein
VSDAILVYISETIKFSVLFSKLNEDSAETEVWKHLIFFVTKEINLVTVFGKVLLVFNL